MWNLFIEPALSSCLYIVLRGKSGSKKKKTPGCALIISEVTDEPLRACVSSRTICCELLVFEVSVSNGLTNVLSADKDLEMCPLSASRLMTPPLVKLDMRNKMSPEIPLRKNSFWNLTLGMVLDTVYISVNSV